jgi:hypothetical protein
VRRFTNDRQQPSLAATYGWLLHWHFSMLLGTLPSSIISVLDICRFFVGGIVRTAALIRILQLFSHFPYSNRIDTYRCVLWMHNRHRTQVHF